MPCRKYDVFTETKQVFFRIFFPGEIQPLQNEHWRRTTKVRVLIIINGVRSVKKALVFGDQLVDNSEAVDVLLRVRPLAQGEETSVTLVDDGTLRIAGRNTTTEFGFDSIVSDSVGQAELFKNVAVPLFYGKSSVLFAYGVSGSGKTFTIQGTQENPGLLPRIIESVFASIPKKRFMVPLENTKSAVPTTNAVTVCTYPLFVVIVL